MCAYKAYKLIQLYKHRQIILSTLLTFQSSVPPSITEGTTNVTVTVNIQTTLSCEATGIPKPTVTWTKDSQPLNTDQNQNMYRFSQVFFLFHCTSL